MVFNGLSNSLHFLIADLCSTAQDRLRQEGLIASIGILRQQDEYRAYIQPKCSTHIRSCLAFTHRFDGLLAHHLQRLVIELATVRNRLAFDAAVISAR